MYPHHTQSSTHRNQGLQFTLFDKKKLTSFRSALLSDRGQTMLGSCVLVILEKIYIACELWKAAGQYFTSTQLRRVQVEHTRGTQKMKKIFSIENMNNGSALYMRRHRINIIRCTFFCLSRIVSLKRRYGLARCWGWVWGWGCENGFVGT